MEIMLCYILGRKEECRVEERQDCGKLIKLIKQINDELRKNANNAMRAQDMTVAQLDALLELDHAPGKQRSLKELEQSLHVAQSTAAGIIARLEQKGFVDSLLLKCRKTTRRITGGYLISGNCAPFSAEYKRCPVPFPSVRRGAALLPPAYPAWQSLRSLYPPE